MSEETCLKVGFTGTQAGTTAAQKAWLDSAFGKIKTPWEFHHGDCIGADANAHDIAVRYGARVVLHPPINDSKRAFRPHDTAWQARPYLERNKEIVDAVDVMIATPREEEEQLRSGTWSTVRYARKKGKKLRIVMPDGTVRSDPN